VNCNRSKVATARCAGPMQRQNLAGSANAPGAARACPSAVTAVGAPAAALAPTAHWWPECHDVFTGGTRGLTGTR
jgi:hypothetical protein